MMRILLAEDDRALNQTLAYQLEHEGFIVDSCYDGEEALFYCEQAIHDIILLDRMLPCLEGTDILKQLRKKGIVTPIILITALGTLTDKVEGLNLGADDYLVKPFAFEELLARIQCVTRRSPVINQTDLPGYCDIQFNEATNTLTGPGGSCSCSKREGAMLDVLIKNGGQTLSRNMLLLKIWGPDSDVEEGNLDNYIYFVRRRLKAVGSRLNLRTIRGIGYCLMEE